MITIDDLDRGLKGGIPKTCRGIWGMQIEYGGEEENENQEDRECWRIGKGKISHSNSHRGW